MSPPAKVAAFALALAASLGAGAALGESVGPIDIRAGDDHRSSHTDSTTTTTAPSGGGFGSHDHGTHRP